MTGTELAAAASLLREVVARFRENSAGSDSSGVVAELAATRELSRLVSQVQVEAVAVLQRGGAFAAAGHQRPESAVAAVLGMDRRQARQIVQAAEHITGRVDPQGHELPVALPAMAAVFRAGATSLEHVTAIARL